MRINSWNGFCNQGRGLVEEGIKRVIDSAYLLSNQDLGMTQGATALNLDFAEPHIGSGQVFKKNRPNVGKNSPRSLAASCKLSRYSATK